MANNTNKITETVGVLIAKDNKVLLVKHTESARHLTGSYGLPAGRIEQGEEAIDAAVRELAEETGLTVLKEDLIHLPHQFLADIPRKGGLIERFRWNVFIAKKFDGQIKESDETVPEWVEFGKVNKLNLIANTENAIKEGLGLLNG